MSEWPARSDRRVHGWTNPGADAAGCWRVEDLVRDYVAAAREWDDTLMAYAVAMARAEAAEAKLAKVRATAKFMLKDARMGRVRNALDDAEQLFRALDGGEP